MDTAPHGAAALDGLAGFPPFKEVVEHHVPSDGDGGCSDGHRARGCHVLPRGDEKQARNDNGNQLVQTYEYHAPPRPL